jgi:hypothetical protein
MTSEAPAAPRDFIREIVEQDLAAGRHQRVITRFPPEPNGYLHIGHAKSICLNFGIAAEFNGQCNLRFDDTNPTKEEVEFAESIKRDVAWLGFSWGDNLFHASDYFGQLYAWAEELIRSGKAYVDSSNADEMRTMRGTLTEPGQESPYRSRTADENLDLFRRMKAGEFPDGAHVLRAKIDMASPNINMRDPVLYRIRHETHHRTGDAWCIYPMYDFAHPRHALALHARVRGSPAAVQLARRDAAGALSAAPVRVRAAEPQLHGDVEAQAAAPRHRAARQRLGRPADADDRRSAPPRLHAGRHSQFRGARRRRQA